MTEGKVDFYNFSNMKIDLSKVGPGQLVLDVFPELRHTKIYTEVEDIELRLAFLTCDPHGPFSTIKQYNTRLASVCRWLKISMEAPDNKLYEDALNLKSENIAKIWTEYLSSTFHHEWVSWFSSSLMYYQMMEQLRRPIDFSDTKEWTQRQAIESRADGIYLRMKKMEELIFVDESIKRKTFNTAKDLIENYPEKHADDTSVI